MTIADRNELRQPAYGNASGPAWLLAELRDHLWPWAGKGQPARKGHPGRRLCDGPRRHGRLGDGGPRPPVGRRDHRLVVWLERVRSASSGWTPSPT
jgi:hypothetical protein